MRALNVLRFVLLGAVGFGIGATLAGALLGVLGLPLTGAVGRASLGTPLGYLEHRKLAGAAKPRVR